MGVDHPLRDEIQDSPNLAIGNVWRQVMKILINMIKNEESGLHEDPRDLRTKDDP